MVNFNSIKREIRRKTHCHPKYYSFTKHREIFPECKSSEKTEEDLNFQRKCFKFKSSSHDGRQYASKRQKLNSKNWKTNIFWQKYHWCGGGRRPGGWTTLLCLTGPAVPPIKYCKSFTLWAINALRQKVQLVINEKKFEGCSSKHIFSVCCWK